MHGRVMTGAEHPRLVDLELVGPDVPVLVRRDTGRVAGVAHFVLIGGDEPDLGGVAAAAVLGDVEARRGEVSGFRIAAELAAPGR